MGDVTRILSEIQSGDPTASEQLLPLVYDELRRLAAAKLAHEKPGHTVQATALVHDAYLRLVDQTHPPHWNSRGHFFGAAARAMQRILVENARRRKRLKVGGDQQRVPLSDSAITIRGPSVDILAVDEALTKLEQIAPRKAELVRLKFFAGLTLAEAARALGVSLSTVENDWAYAKAWLRVEMREAGEDPPDLRAGNQSD